MQRLRERRQLLLSGRGDLLVDLLSSSASIPPTPPIKIPSSNKPATRGTSGLGTSCRERSRSRWTGPWRSRLSRRTSRSATEGGTMDSVTAVLGEHAKPCKAEVRSQITLLGSVTSFVAPSKTIVLTPPFLSSSLLPPPSSLLPPPYSLLPLRTASAPVAQSRAHGLDR